MKSQSLLTATVLIGLLFIGCGNDNQERRNTLEKENNELRQRLMEKNSNVETRAKYVFVILYVEQKEGYPPEVMTYTNVSGIEEITNLDEDRQYKIMDEYQSHYLKSAKALIYNGAVRDREIKVFDTYAQASRAKEELVKSHYN